MALLRKINVYRCPECQKPYKTLGAWASHMNAVHPEARPKGYSDLRFFYYVLTGKTHGTCVVCKKDTEWNEETGKYNRFCNNPKCKEIYKEEFRKRMMDKYGKITRMDEPEFFKKALAAKKISGTYKFKDGGELTYTGTYEKDFLQMMDTLLSYKSSDIMAPSPHTYYYMYEGKKHYYIPDFYIPNVNLEIEIKQNESTHPKILAVDKVKEKLKDEVMIANKKVNYLKLVDKNYEPIIQYLLNLKEQIPDRDMKASDLKKAERVLESTIGSYIQRKEDISSVLESIVYPEDIPLDTSDYNELVCEGLIIDDKTIKLRLDKWKREKNKNILFITGLSGSGKTTVGEEYEKKYNAHLFELDGIEHNYDSSGCGILTHLQKVSDENSDPIATLKRLIPKAISYMYSMPDKLFIVEGIQIYQGYVSKSLLEKAPLIIIGASLVKTIYRRKNRDKLTASDITKAFLSGIKEIKLLNAVQENALGTLTDSRPYDNPIPTPAPDPEYDPINVTPSMNIKTPGAFLKSDNVVKAMVPCVLDEISGEPSDGLSKMKLPVKELVTASSADPNSEEVITDRDRAIKKTNAILEKFDSYALLSRNKKLQEIKDLILKWNIDIDLSKYPKVKREMLQMNKPASESIYTNGYVFDYVGDYFKDLPIPIFESTIKNPDDLHPVYILLIHSGTLLANIIQKYTKDKYSHASISFDPSFKEFYSFGRKKNASGGFTIESRDDDFYNKRPECPYGIYVTFITSEQKNAMKNKLQYFIDNEDKFKYHFMGLAKIAFNKISENDTKYFCSGFVADILQAGGIATNRNYTLYKPQDLFHIYGSYKVDEGQGLQNIDPDVVIKNTQIVKEKYVKRFTK